MEQQCPAGGAERQISELVEDHEVAAHQPIRNLARSALDFLLLQGIDQVDGAEEPNLLAMVFNRLNAKRRRDMGFARARTAHQNDIVGRLQGIRIDEAGEPGLH